MKPIPHAIKTAFASLALMLALPSLAQEITTTTTTGTISDFGGERIVVRTESSPDPVTYSFSKTTTYVDEAGNPVSIKTVKSGLPVTVHYSRVGDGLVADKVVVRKRTATVPGRTTETTTTTHMGTISEFDPNAALVIRSESSAEPIRYRFSKTTTYVDEAGNPVSIKTVKSGLPVTVHYTQSGDEMIASRVIVRKTTTARPPASITETRTTTMGTVNEFSPERIIIRSETSPDPITYQFSKTTTYVDETGAPVSVDLIKSGLPVTVHYADEGGARVATKVIVRKKTTTVVPR